MQGKDDKVIHAFSNPELPKNPMTIAGKPAGAPLWCNHEAIQLDEHDRAVHCTRCGATLDPFNFLLHNAKTLQQAWMNHRAVNNKVKELNERVAHLTKEEKRLRSQVKRLQDKTAGVIDVRGKATL